VRRTCAPNTSKCIAVHIAAHHLDSILGQIGQMLAENSTNWVVPEKIHTPPTEEISAVRRGRGEKNCFR
jgi:hypothetical protein